MARSLRRGHHRRRPQRPDLGGLSGARGPAHGRAGAASRPRRRGGHRGDRPRLPLLRRELRGQPAAAGDHPRAAAAAHGLDILPLDGTFTPLPKGAGAHTGGGDYLWRVNDHGRTVRELRRWSLNDAEAYEEYGQLMVEMARFIKPILGIVPGDPTDLDPRPLLPLVGLARTFGGLTERQQAVFVQLMTMSAADFLDQWFETDPLKATMSASGIIGTYQGIRSPGTAYVLLHHYMGEIDGAFRAWGIPKGGTGGVSRRSPGPRRRSAPRSGPRRPSRGSGRAAIARPASSSRVVRRSTRRSC